MFGGAYEGMILWFVVGLLGLFVFWGLVIGLVVWGIRALGRRDGRSPAAETPLQIAERRFARGEISREQFEEIKETLGRDAGSPGHAYRA